MTTAPIECSEEEVETRAVGGPRTQGGEDGSTATAAARWSEDLGFGGFATPVPPDRLDSWGAADLSALYHAGERLGCELLVGWSPNPSPRRLRSWANRLAKRSPLRRFVHVLAEPEALNGRVLMAMASPDRPAAREVAVRVLDDETVGVIARIDAEHREHLTLRLIDVLGREAVTSRFFSRFRHHLGCLETAWTRSGPPLDERARRDLAMTTLCRLMFVTFLARSGRLGAVDTVRWLVDQPRQGSLYRDVLRPVFFGVLNTPASERDHEVARFDDLPFLNGGLFQPLEVEHGEGLDLADDPLVAAIDELFEGYELTATERDPGRSIPAVDPEMLGQVFEALMHAEERRSSGTFYTPAHLVRRLLRDVLTTWADRKVARWGDWVRATLDDESPPPLPESELVGLDEALAAVTIVDPAVGSGAFLLGARDALVDLRAALRSCRGEPVDRYALARHAITHNLYGVDVSLGAVRLCELRLWLSLVVEAPAHRPLEPLPNLDHHIRQGDSLTGPGDAAGASSDGPSFSRQLAVDWPASGSLPLRNTAHGPDDYANLHGIEKTRRARELRQAELRRLGALLADERATVREALEELERAVSTPDLFGETSAPTERQRLERRRLVERLEELDAAQLAITRGELPAFSFRAAFPDVAARGGFEIVLGNPPWVRLHDIGPTERRRLRGRFSFCRGLGSGFHAQTDLSTVFVERAFELAAPDGLVGLLLPVKLFRARYGRSAREALVERFSVLHYADLSLSRSRLFTASNYPAWLLAAPTSASRTDTCRATIAAIDGRWISTTRQTHSLPRGKGPSGPWVALPPAATAALDAMAEGRVSLREYGLAPSLGLKTGRNRVFVAERWERIDDETVRLEMVDGTLLEVPQGMAPLACRGRDLRAFGCAPAARVLVCYDRDSLKPLRRLEPGVRSYFERHAKALRRRRDARSRSAPWRLFRTRALAPGRKVIWRDIAPRLEAVCCEADEVVPLNTAYFVRPADCHEAFVLTALLNARWARLYTAAIAEPAMSSYLRFLAWTVGRLPWPSKLRLGSRTAKRLEALSRVAHEAWTPELQAELDDRLAWAWGLDDQAQRALSRLEPFYPKVIV